MDKAAVIKSLEGRVSKTAGDYIARAVFVADNFDAAIRNVAEAVPDEGEMDYIFDEAFDFFNAWKRAEAQGRVLRPNTLGVIVSELAPGLSEKELREYISGSRKVDKAFEKAFERIVSAYTHISPLAMVSGDFDGDLDERVSVVFDGESYTLRLAPELAEKLVGEFLS